MVSRKAVSCVGICAVEVHLLGKMRESLYCTLSLEAIPDGFAGAVGSAFASHLCPREVVGSSPA